MDSLVCVVCVSLIWVITAFLKTATTSGGGGGGGGGGGTGTPDFKWQGWSNGDKNKKEKIPGPKFNHPPPPPQKKEKNPIPGYAETIRNLQIVLNTQKNSLLKSRYQKKYFLKFSSQNFKPKQSFHHSRHMKSGVPLRGATYIIYQVSGGICSVNLTI